ncbi:MAG: MerR family transcriptional regulator [Desulfonatronovibrio sp. MSAO_Bac4]|nr:MAG: MerR family transcriptional regulator [Desulfonatronovibrio sp. MSAO_Bac4]
MSQELLTIKEIARRLGLPESNIRYYRDKYEKYLPSVGSGRKKRFKPQAVDVFKTVVQGLEEGLSSREIESRLAARFSQNPADIYQDKEINGNSYPEIYPESKMEVWQEVMFRQANTMEKMADALKLERGVRQEIIDIRQGHARIKKALHIIWQKHKKDQTKVSGPKEESLTEIKTEIKDLRSKQEDLENRFQTEISGLKEELKKCQFWTKRVLMQSSSSKVQDEGNKEGSEES